MSSRRLAVVIPALDEAGRIGPLVERLLLGDPGEYARRASHDRADLVVVSDGGSRDGTQQEAILAGALLVEGPAGRGAQMQLGAKRACEQLGPDDLLLFVHADNMPADGALAALGLAAAETAAVGFGLRQSVQAQGAFYRMVEALADRRVERGVVYGDSCLGVKVGAYWASGGFLDLPLFEDLELCRRLGEIGPVSLVRGGAVKVCARRWEREGKSITVVRNWLVTRAFRLGVPLRWLAIFYPRHPAPGASERT